jgi:ankyrin repeat protein
VLRFWFEGLKTFEFCYKDVDLSKILVEAGPDIHLRSNKGNTPLIWYSYSGYLEGIQYLVSLGAVVNAKNQMVKPLIILQKNSLILTCWNT